MNVNFVNGSMDFIFLLHQKTWNGEASSERSEDDWTRTPLEFIQITTKNQKKPDDINLNIT